MRRKASQPDVGVDRISLPPAIAKIAQKLIPFDEEGSEDQGEPELPMQPSAVLVLLFPRQSEIRFLLTARPSHLSRHAGQVSLPGGSFEADDHNLWETALRETREELGIDTDAIRPLGRLTELPMRVTEFLISPFVAWIPDAPEVRPDTSEVEEVIEASLAWIAETDRIATEDWNYRSQLWKVTFYRLAGHAVWGATARILWDLATRIDPQLAEIDPAPGSVTPVERSGEYALP